MDLIEERKSEANLSECKGRTDHKTFNGPNNLLLMGMLDDPLVIEVVNDEFMESHLTI